MYTEECGIDKCVLECYIVYETDSVWLDVHG